MNLRRETSNGQEYLVLDFGRGKIQRWAIHASDSHVGTSAATDREQRMGLYEAMIFGPKFEHSCPSCTILDNPSDDERKRIAQWWKWEGERLSDGMAPRCPLEE